MLTKTSKAISQYGFEWQKESVQEIKRVISEILQDTTPLAEVDLGWLEMCRSWVNLISSEILEFPFCSQAEEEEVNKIQAALYRVSLEVYRVQK